MSNSSEHSVPNGLCACFMLVFAATFLPWGMRMASPDAVLPALGNVSAFGFSELSLEATGWSGSITIGSLEWFNTFVVVSAFIATLTGYLPSQRIQKWKREMAWFFIFCAMLHLLVFSQQYMVVYSGFVWTLFGLVGMTVSLLMFHPLPAEHEFEAEPCDESDDNSTQTPLGLETAMFGAQINEQVKTRCKHLTSTRTNQADSLPRHSRERLTFFAKLLRA